MAVYVKLPSGSIIETDHPEYHADAQRIPAAEGKRLLKADAIKYLRKVLKRGDTVYTVLRHVSASGMSRRIDLYAIKGNRPVYLTGYAARAMDYPAPKDRGITVQGCGMDMGFHLVYNLSMSLFCPKKYDHDAAYALKHEWI